MQEIKTNDTIKVHYTGSLSDGTIFDSSVDREPLEFKVGEGKLIKGFEEAVIGMKKDESKTINLASDEAYGPPRNELIQEIQKTMLPPELTPEVGMELVSKSPDGQEFIVRVKEIKDDSIIIDGNHPLAGKDLTFEITVVEIAG